MINIATEIYNKFIEPIKTNITYIYNNYIKKNKENIYRNLGNNLQIEQDFDEKLNNFLLNLSSKTQISAEAEKIIINNALHFNTIFHSEMNKATKKITQYSLIMDSIVEIQDNSSIMLGKTNNDLNHIS